jgi:hypothetical protein
MRKSDGYMGMFRKIISWFSKIKQTESLQENQLVNLLDMLAKTETHEISCDDVGAALAEFTEMHQRGEDVKHLMPLVHQHLQMCRDCQEEFEALMAALEAESQ